MMHGDYRSNGLRYLRQCEGLRTDVELLEIQVSVAAAHGRRRRL